MKVFADFVRAPMLKLWRKHPKPAGFKNDLKKKSLPTLKLRQAKAEREGFEPSVQV
jgi:hypothetical protein